MNYQPEMKGLIMSDSETPKEVQDVVGEALDDASRAIRKALKALTDLDLKKAAMQAVLLRADVERVAIISNEISEARQALVDADQCLINAHIAATDLTMDDSNQMNTRSGR